jgi:hypothetical protein
MAVTAGLTGTTAVEKVKAPLVPAMQKPLRWVGKRFRYCLEATPKKE